MKTAIAGILLAVVAYVVLAIQPLPAQVQNLQTQQAFTQREMLTIREYVETLFIAHQREHVLIQGALDKAENTMNERLEGMNEFRDALKESNNLFATKDQLEPLVRFQDRFWGVVAGLLVMNGLVTALVVMVMRDRFNKKAG